MRNRILLVDDELGTLQLLERYLARRGYEIESATSLEGAMALVREGRYELVITDLCLGGSTRQEGLEILELLGDQRPQPRAVLITAFRSPDVEARASAYGVDAILDKPQPLPAIAALVSKLLGPVSTPCCHTARPA